MLNLAATDHPVSAWRGDRPAQLTGMTLLPMGGFDTVSPLKPDRAAP